MTIPVATRRQRIDRIYLIASGNQCLDEKTLIGLYADNHVRRLVCMRGYQFMESSDAFDALLKPTLCQPGTVGVFDVNVVMILCPIIAYEYHSCLLARLLPANRRKLCGDLMDQCSAKLSSTTRHPMSHLASSPCLLY